MSIRHAKRMSEQEAKCTKCDCAGECPRNKGQVDSASPKIIRGSMKGRTSDGQFLQAE